MVRQKKTRRTTKRKRITSLESAIYFLTTGHNSITKRNVSLHFTLWQITMRTHQRRWKNTLSGVAVTCALGAGAAHNWQNAHFLFNPFIVALRWCVYFSDTFHGHFYRFINVGQNWPRQFSGQSSVALYGILASYPEHIMRAHLSSSPLDVFRFAACLLWLHHRCIQIACGCCYLSIKCAHNNRRKNCAINLPVIVLCLDEKETCENWLISTKTSNETAVHYVSVWVLLTWDERARTHTHTRSLEKTKSIDFPVNLLY